MHKDKKNKICKEKEKWKQPFEKIDFCEIFVQRLETWVIRYKYIPKLEEKSPYRLLSLTISIYVTWRLLNTYSMLIFCIFWGPSTCVKISSRSQFSKLSQQAASKELHVPHKIRHHLFGYSLNFGVFDDWAIIENIYVGQKFSGQLKI